MFSLAHQHGNGLRWLMLADWPSGWTAACRNGAGHPGSYQTQAELTVGSGTAWLPARGWSSVVNSTKASVVAAPHGWPAGLCTSRPARYWGLVTAVRAVLGGSGRWRTSLPSRCPRRIRQTDLLPCLPLPEVEVSGVRLSSIPSTLSVTALFECLTAIVETTTAHTLGCLGG